MSRIGKLPITVPSGVDVAIDGRTVTVKGPKGTLSHTIVEPITIERSRFWPYFSVTVSDLPTAPSAGSSTL